MGLEWKSTKQGKWKDVDEEDVREQPQSVIIV